MFDDDILGEDTPVPIPADLEDAYWAFGSTMAPSSAQSAPGWPDFGF